MTDQETRQILKTCLSELRKIQKDPNHLNVGLAEASAAAPSAGSIQSH